METNEIMNNEAGYGHNRGNRKDSFQRWIQ